MFLGQGFDSKSCVMPTQNFYRMKFVCAVFSIYAGGFCKLCMQKGGGGGVLPLPPILSRMRGLRDG